MDILVKIIVVYGKILNKKGLTKFAGLKVPESVLVGVKQAPNNFICSTWLINCRK